MHPPPLRVFMLHIPFGLFAEILLRFLVRPGRTIGLLEGHVRRIQRIWVTIEKCLVALQLRNRVLHAQTVYVIVIEVVYNDV